MDNLNIVNITKKTALLLMAVYFTTVTVISYKTEYYQISNFTFLAFAGMVMLYRAEKNSVIMSKFYFLAIPFLAFSVMSYYWAIEKSIVISRNSTYLNLVFLCIIIINIIETTKDFKFALKSFVAASVLMCIYTYLFYGFDNIKLMMLQGERIGGEINQENAFGLICGLGFVISICYGVFDNNKKYYLYSALLAISILMTGSRTSILTILIILGAVIVLNTLSKKIIGTVILLITLSIVLSLISQSEYLSFIFDRFEMFGNFFKTDNINIADLSTKTRFEMMKYGLKWFSQNPIIGYGTQQYDILYATTFGRLKYAHNWHIQMLVDHGTLGYILLIMMFILPMKKSLKYVRKNTESAVVFLLLLFLLINGMGNMFNSQKVFWIAIGLCFSYLYVYRDEGEK